MGAYIFDSGRFCVAVPDGWKAFYGTDSGGKETQKKVHVYKDASEMADIFTHVGVTVCFFGKEDYYLSTKSFYDNVTDIQPFALDCCIWSGYTCTSLGYPYTMLEGKQDGCVFQVMVLTKNGEHEIALDDEDVQSIVQSIAPTK